MYVGKSSARGIGRQGQGWLCLIGDTKATRGEMRHEGSGSDDTSAVTLSIWSGIIYCLWLDFEENCKSEVIE